LQQLRSGVVRKRRSGARFGNYQIVHCHESAQNFYMTIRLTGAQLAAGRTLACLSRHELAERAGLSYHSIRAWERSSHSIPEATYSHLCRAVDVLEAEGVCFTHGGVQRTAPTSTVIESARVVA
jgi:DNA-binding transcriptional regulator YiaG